MQAAPSGAPQGSSPVPFGDGGSKAERSGACRFSSAFAALVREGPLRPRLRRGLPAQSLRASQSPAPCPCALASGLPPQGGREGPTVKGTYLMKVLKACAQVQGALVCAASPTSGPRLAVQAKRLTSSKGANSPRSASEPILVSPSGGCLWRSAEDPFKYQK